MSLDLSYDIHVLGTPYNAHEEQETEVVDVSTDIMRLTGKSAMQQTASELSLPRAA